MSVAIPTLPQYAFMAWCSVKSQGQLYLTIKGKIVAVLLNEHQAMKAYWGSGEVNRWAKVEAFFYAQLHVTASVFLPSKLG
jgi:hypothetical protein